nr:uncharacterized protein LOC105337770 [Crassostrea gigas]
MDNANSLYRVHQCSNCPGDTEYQCLSCPCNLCPQCKETHVKDLKTIDHNIELCRKKINYIPKQEIYRKYCEPCKIPVSYHSRKHRKHRTLDITTAYITERQLHRGIIQTIRSEALFHRHVLMTGLKNDFKTCEAEFSLYPSKMLTKADTLKDLIDDVLYDLLNNVSCDFDFKHRCLKEKIDMQKHIVSLQRYLNIYEQPAFSFSALEFLSTIKKVRLFQIYFTLHTSQFSMSTSLNKKDLMESLSTIQITEKGNRRLENESLLKLMSGPELCQSLTLTDVGGCAHISCVTSDRVCVSDENKLILTNTTGITLHNAEDIWKGDGLHTLNTEGELIYIDRNFNINKLSRDMKTTSSYIERTDAKWRPRCVYWSLSTGDLLVAMNRETSDDKDDKNDNVYYYDTDHPELKTYTWIGKVDRYNRSGQLTQSKQHDNTGLKLYRKPHYIAENNNWDVVVSDHYSVSGAVVVTDREGRYRFSYTGHPPESNIRPNGISTDALSNILVCDKNTNTVQMMDRNGQFLSYLLIRPSGIITPHSLSYDVNTHRLWVGSEYNSTVVIYRYITKKDALTASADVMQPLNEIKTTETEKPHQEQEYLLKVIFPPEFLHSLSLTGVKCCYHISYVTSDQVWVSDYKNNIILTNTTGDTLHHVKDSFSGSFNYGIHTVNSESKLIYIDKNYNINKLSKDMKTTTTFIERTDSAWKPLCVYWTPSTRGLLVGMYREKLKTGKVNRYNQSGQLIQSIEHDNTGLELYSQPIYITENNNGDVVVSDLSAVVVTERGGRHRFSYTGHPSGSGLTPYGICTDALSHILVCDDTTKTLQMLDKDGQFLTNLLIKPSGIYQTQGIGYDVNTHSVFGSDQD